MEIQIIKVFFQNIMSPVLFLFTEGKTSLLNIPREVLHAIIHGIFTIRQDEFVQLIQMHVIVIKMSPQALPVPKLSSPQTEHIPASIRFPKNFHPVGT